MKSFSIISAAVAATLIAAPVVGAEVRVHPIAVVELFTSQGCSESPSADARLTLLGKRDDVIALAYHVDYWDYIGWTDTFGSKANTDRQKAYAQSWGTSRIYTPQIIVNGMAGVVGSHDTEVTEALGKATLDVPVDLTLGDNMLTIDVPAQAGGADAMIWLVTFKDHAEVAIASGENAGKTLDYTQIVTSRQMLGMWDAATGSHFKLPLSELMTGGANGAVIMVQTGKSGLPGAILGAASVQL